MLCDSLHRPKPVEGLVKEVDDCRAMDRPISVRLRVPLRVPFRAPLLSGSMMWELRV